MMSRVGAYLSIQGELFSPARAEAELGVDFGPAKNEPGALGTRGKFAGRAIPYGSASWVFQWETGELIPDSFPPFSVPGLKGKLAALGAEDITLYVDVAYIAQCNFELSPALLGALAELGITVAISCYEAGP